MLGSIQTRHTINTPGTGARYRGVRCQIRSQITYEIVLNSRVEQTKIFGFVCTWLVFVLPRGRYGTVFLYSIVWHNHKNTCSTQCVQKSYPRPLASKIRANCCCYENRKTNDQAFRYSTIPYRCVHKSINVHYTRKTPVDIFPCDMKIWCLEPRDRCKKK